MLSFAPVAAALFFAASALAQNPPLVNTPINPPVCQPLLITWGGGTPPYFLSVLPGNDPTGNVVLDFGQQTGTQLTWIVNVTAGTSLGFTLRDSTGATSQSGAFTVQTSTDQSCLNAKATSAGSAASTPAGTTVTTTPAASTPAASTPAVTTPKASTTAPGSSAAGSSAGSAASSSASVKPSSAATAQKVSYGIAGAVGAAVIALLA